MADPLVLPGGRHVTSVREAELAEALLRVEAPRAGRLALVDAERDAYHAFLSALERCGPLPRHADVLMAAKALEEAQKDLADAYRVALDDWRDARNCLDALAD